MKIIACDFDGTLFQENGIGISCEDSNAIKRFRSNGGLFGIVTGRDLTASKFIIESLPSSLDFLICSTGAIICDSDGNIVSQEKSNKIKAICEIADFSLKHNLLWFSVINEGARYYLDLTANDSSQYKSIKEFNNCTIWFKTIEDAKAVEKYIERNHKNDFTFFRNFECIEITPLGVTKATAVKELASKYDAVVFAIGDGATDIPMITEFYGFAVENANDCLKKASKHHCSRLCDMIDTILEQDRYDK